MPLLVVESNCNIDDVSSFLNELGNLVANLLGKPLQYVMVQFKHVPMIMGGTNDPCASLHLHSIGKISKEENKKTSESISKFINTKLGVSEQRMYIFFNDYLRENVGWNNTTFAN